MSLKHILVIAAFAGGCGPGTTLRNKIGDACTDADMTQGNCETGSICLHKFCTKACSQQGGELHPSDGTLGGCPVGFDCGAAQAGDTMATCYRATYGAGCTELLACAAVAAPDKVAMYTASYGPSGTCVSMNSPAQCEAECGALLAPLRAKSMDPACVAPATADAKNFGVDCSAFAKGCGAAQNPCAMGFDCHATLKCDPAAFCTTSCTADSDCPPRFFCGTDSSGTHACLKRSDCSDCAVEDQCPDGYHCAVDSKGGHFCGKTCAGGEQSTDCPQPLNGANHFVVCKADMLGRQVCTPAQGACHGPSALSGQPEGGICSACRAGVAGDCMMGATCISDSFTTERFCSVKCTVTVTAQGAVTADSCPDGSFCDLGGAAGAGTYMAFCAGDPSYLGVTCYP